MSDERQGWLGWHFAPESGRTRYSCELIEAGVTLVERRPLDLCNVGLHASKRAIDAMRYAPGPIVSRVRLSGSRLDSHDKSCAEERTHIAVADATLTLHEWACRCAAQVLHLYGKDSRLAAAIEIKRRWLRGEATDQELAAASAAASAAAWDAASAATRAAASAAAWDAAWGVACAAASAAAWAAARAAAWAAASAAACAAASAAAWDAAWDAAWAAQNEELEAMLRELLGL